MDLQNRFCYVLVPPYLAFLVFELDVFDEGLLDELLFVELLGLSRVSGCR